ncbi:MAG TPA: tetratricopeptide repeat protein, partial [Kofleriaceae bacterium]
LVCVDETWARTAMLLARIDAADPAATREAADDLGEVPPFERCARGSLPAVPEDLPADTRVRYEDLSKQIQTIERETTLKPRERTAKLRALAPAIEALHYPPLDARWHWGIGHTLNDATDSAGAAAEFDLAAQAGLAAGDDNLYVRALIMELNLVSTTASPERIAQLESQAQAGAKRLANPQVDAELARSRAVLYMDRGELAKSRELFEQADALYSKLAIAPMTMHIAVLQNLGAVCLESGDLDAAERALDRAVDLSRRRFTEQGAFYWETRAARGTVYLARRDFTRAEAEMRAAADGLERTAPDGTQLGRLRAYICMLLRVRKDYGGARAECAASLAAIRTTVGPDSPHEVWTLYQSGHVELAAEDYAGALGFLERAVALAKHDSVRPIERATAQTYLAIALLGAKRIPQARALAAKIAPVLRGPELEESRGDFVRAFPDLAAQATP